MRERFLELIWNLEPYPEAQTGAVQGRLEGISEDQLTLIISQAVHIFGISKGLVLAPGYKPNDVLRPGDIVELKLNGDRVIECVKLLVPSRGRNPFSGSFNVIRAGQWMTFTQFIRTFFVDHGFLELKTPTLVPSPGLEPFLDPFETQWVLGKQKQTLYLPTSPEFHLKKALVQGFEKCFEFKDCFRNGEKSEHHQPEFLMLEWYRAFTNLDALKEDLHGLIEGLQKTFFPKEKIFKINLVKMEELWQESLQFELTPKTTIEELKTLASQINIEVRENDFDDLFNLIFLEKIEPRLKQKEEPTLIWHYPPSQAALARLTSDGWADRFELYWRGLEIANAFNELNDPFEQRRRFYEDQKKKTLLEKKVVPVDEEFLSGLEWGMPPSSGIALGMDRLFMALFKIEEIKDCRLFSL